MENGGSVCCYSLFYPLCVRNAHQWSNENGLNKTKREEKKTDWWNMQRQHGHIAYTERVCTVCISKHTHAHMNITCRYAQWSLELWFDFQVDKPFRGGSRNISFSLSFGWTNNNCTTPNGKQNSILLRHEKGRKTILL